MKLDYFLTVGLLTIAVSTSVDGSETIADYWPIAKTQSTWRMVAFSDKDSSSADTRLIVTNKTVGRDEFELWFSGKPKQPAGASAVERFERCENGSADPWLFFREYVNVLPGRPNKSHPVRAIRILFTPEGEDVVDLVADGTYARCGNIGQPYLRWHLDLNYRIQVWGYLTENTKWKWYWDAQVSKPNFIENECLNPSQKKRAIRVQEAWWSNFKAPLGEWKLGKGDTGEDGWPTGKNVLYGRSVWHAEGQLPYFMTGNGPGTSVRLCVNSVEERSDN